MKPNGKPMEINGKPMKIYENLWESKKIYGNIIFRFSSPPVSCCPVVVACGMCGSLWNVLYAA